MAGAHQHLVVVLVVDQPAVADRVEPVDPSGDVAYCESYAIGHHVRSEGGRDVDDRVMGLRYDDRFERRDGEWRIADRVVRYEWLRVDACDALDGEWTLGTVDAQDSSWSG